MSCIDSSGMRRSKWRQSHGYTTMCRKSENWSNILYFSNMRLNYRISAFQSMVGLIISGI